MQNNSRIFYDHEKPPTVELTGGAGVGALTGAIVARVRRRRATNAAVTTRTTGARLTVDDADRVERLAGDVHLESVDHQTTHAAYACARATRQHKYTI